VYGEFSQLAYYYAELAVGSPPQRVTAILDTGSSALTLPCDTCGSEGGCGPHRHVFNSSASATARLAPCDPASHCNRCARGGGGGGGGDASGGRMLTDTAAQLCLYDKAFAEGSTLSGVYVRDRVGLWDGGSGGVGSGSGGVPRVDLQFGCHVAETGLFRSPQVADGLLGLSQGALALIPTLYATGAIPRHAFSLCLSSAGGTLGLGGANLQLHTGPAAATDMIVSQDNGWYVMGLTGLRVRDAASGNGSVAGWSSSGARAVAHAAPAAAAEAHNHASTRAAAAAPAADAAAASPATGEAHAGWNAVETPVPLAAADAAAPLPTGLGRLLSPGTTGAGAASPAPHGGVRGASRMKQQQQQPDGAAGTFTRAAAPPQSDALLQAAASVDERRGGGGWRAAGLDAGAGTPVVIDSGSSFSYLPPAAVDALVSGILAACATGSGGGCGMRVATTAELPAAQHTCFHLDSELSYDAFPVVDLQTVGGAPFVVTARHYLVDMPWTHPLACVGVYSNEHAGGRSVIGANLLAHRDVLFDVEARRFAWAPAWCPRQATGRNVGAGGAGTWPGGGGGNSDTAATGDGAVGNDLGDGGNGGGGGVASIVLAAGLVGAATVASCAFCLLACSRTSRTAQVVARLGSQLMAGANGMDKRGGPSRGRRTHATVSGDGSSMVRRVTGRGSLLAPPPTSVDAVSPELYDRPGDDDAVHDAALPDDMDDYDRNHPAPRPPPPPPGHATSSAIRAPAAPVAVGGSPALRRGAPLT